MNDKPIEITGVSRDASGAPVLHYIIKCQRCGQAAEGMEFGDNAGQVFCVRCMLNCSSEGVEATPAAFLEDGRYRPVILRSDEPDSMYILNTLCDTAEAATSIAEWELLRFIEGTGWESIHQ